MRKKLTIYIIIIIFILLTNSIFAQKSDFYDKGIFGMATFDSKFFHQDILFKFEISNIPIKGTIERYYYDERKALLIEKLYDDYAGKIINMLTSSNEWVYRTTQEMVDQKIVVPLVYGVVTIVCFNPVNDYEALYTDVEIRVEFVDPNGNAHRLDNKTNLEKIDFVSSLRFSFKNNGLWISKEDENIIPNKRLPVVTWKEITVERLYLQLLFEQIPK